MHLDDGTLAESEREKAVALAQQFSSVFQAPSNAVSIRQQINVNSTEDEFWCTREWVAAQLEHMNSRKATGVDGIAPVFLKNLYDILAPAVCLLINRSISESALPAEWKLARVAPVRKGSKVSQPADFRPISIICSIALLAEKHIYSRVRDQIDSGLPAFQYGFRRARGTLDALVHAEESIAAGWNVCTTNKRPTNVAVVSLDLSKAFDTIPHTAILSALGDEFNIAYPLLRWISSFLSGRRQFVRVGTSDSSCYDVTSGVPQGSILGPLLYIAATSSIQRIQLASDTTILAYADDLLLIKPILSSSDLDVLSNDVDKLNEYFNNVGMHFNSGKTAFMLATLGRPSSRLPVTLRIGMDQIDESPTLKYLGINLDRRLSFVDHIKQKAKQARQMLASVQIPLRKWRKFKSIHRIYQSCIKPCMTYMLPLLFGVSGQGDYFLQRVDALAARVSLNDYTLRVDELAEKGWATLESSARSQRMHYICRQMTGGPLNHRITPSTTRHSQRLGTIPILRVQPDYIKGPQRALDTMLRRTCKEWNALK